MYFSYHLVWFVSHKWRNAFGQKCFTIELRWTTSVVSAIVVFIGALILVFIHGHLYCVARRFILRERRRRKIVFGRHAEIIQLRSRKIRMKLVAAAVTVFYLICYVPATILLLLLLKSSNYLRAQFCCFFCLKVAITCVLNFVASFA